MKTEYKLKYPIKINSVETETLTLRRATVLDIEVMNQETNKLTQSISMISLLSNITPDEVRSLDVSDFNGLSGVVEGFLE